MFERFKQRSSLFSCLLTLTGSVHFFRLEWIGSPSKRRVIQSVINLLPTRSTHPKRGIPTRSSTQPSPDLYHYHRHPPCSSSGSKVRRVHNEAARQTDASSDLFPNCRTRVETFDGSPICNQLGTLDLNPIIHPTLNQSLSLSQKNNPLVSFGSESDS